MWNLKQFVSISALEKCQRFEGKVTLKVIFISHQEHLSSAGNTVTQVIINKLDSRSILKWLFQRRNTPTVVQSTDWIYCSYSLTAVWSHGNTFESKSEPSQQSLAFLCFSSPVCVSVCLVDACSYQSLHNNRKQFANVLKIAFPILCSSIERCMHNFINTISALNGGTDILKKKKISLLFLSYGKAVNGPYHTKSPLPTSLSSSFSLHPSHQPSGTQSLIPPRSKHYAAVCWENIRDLKEIIGGTACICHSFLRLRRRSCRSDHVDVLLLSCSVSAAGLTHVWFQSDTCVTHSASIHGFPVLCNLLRLPLTHVQVARRVEAEQCE